MGLSLCCPALVVASTVRGSLDLAAFEPPEDASEQPTYRWELQNGFKEVLPNLIPTRELSVVLTGTPEQVAHTGQADKVQVPLYGGELLPSTVVLRQGATLEIENRDEVAHALTAPGLTGLDGEVLGPNARRALHLQTNGQWTVHDTLVPHARGHIHVRSDLVATAELATDGRFRFDNVEPGTYTLRVFHGADELATQPLQVTGRVVEVPSLIPQAETTR